MTMTTDFSPRQLAAAARSRAKREREARREAAKKLSGTLIVPHTTRAVVTGFKELMKERVGTNRRPTLNFDEAVELVFRSDSVADNIEPRRPKNTHHFEFPPRSRMVRVAERSCTTFMIASPDGSKNLVLRRRPDGYFELVSASGFYLSGRAAWPHDPLEAVGLWLHEGPDE